MKLNDDTGEESRIKAALKTNSQTSTAGGDDIEELIRIPEKVRR
jgi:hypothetical protein